jgi:hypothetical protein
MYLPRGNGHGVLVSRIAAPQALDQGGCWLPPSYHVLLSLLLLHFEGKT